MSFFLPTKHVPGRDMCLFHGPALHHLQGLQSPKAAEERAGAGEREGGSEPEGGSESEMQRAGLATALHLFLPLL